MENIYIDGTNRHPEVQCDAEKGLISIKGKAIPEDAEKFFQPIVDWIVKYTETQPEKTEINFQLEYFNTSSSKWLLLVFKKLEVLQEQNGQTEINWFYDDEDLLEYMQEIKELLNIDVKTVEIS